MPPKSAKVLDSTDPGIRARHATQKYPSDASYSPVSSSPVRERRASIEEEPDADQPSGPPRPLTPGRPIIDLNDPPYDETVPARSSKEAVAARGSKSKSANSAATSDSFTRTEGALVTDHTVSNPARKPPLFLQVEFHQLLLLLTPCSPPPRRESSKRTLNANALWFTPSGAEQPFLEKDKPAMYSKAVSIFQGISVMDRFELFDEPLHASISRYYPPWDEWNDEDPLADYGAVDGHLPQGRPDEEALLLREVLIRWSHPDTDCTWTDLPSAVDNLQRQRLTIKDLVTYDEKGTKFYSFHARLLEIGMIVLALSQIIRSLADFFYGEKRQTFVIDKDFQFL
ncbi:hypothetical protein BJ912DRAFT_1054425 [Pholiota molesta]|nr:hypothetical protein BJ912DRAFT_1054425 [Pholiota molesta]